MKPSKIRYNKNSFKKLTKRAGVAQLVAECLSSTLETLCSIPSTACTKIGRDGHSTGIHENLSPGKEILSIAMQIDR